MTASAPRRATLERKLDRFGLFALAFGSMIGVGWVTALGSWLELAGPVGAVIAFLMGGIIMTAIGLCYAEVTPMLPVAGGEVAYAYKAYDVSKSFVVGWFLAFGYISVSAFEAISVGKVLSFLVPGLDRWPMYTIEGDPVYLSHVLLGVGCTGLITAIHYRGVGQAAAVQKWLTGAFVIVTLAFVGAGLIGGDIANLRPYFPSGEAGGVATLGGALAVMVTVPFWFVGFDTIPQGAEEAEATVPPKRLGSLILLAIAGAVLFYVAVIVSVSMTGPWQTLLGTSLVAAEAFERAFGSPLLARLVLVAALLGLFTSWNGFFLAGSRVVFALGRGRIIAPRLGETHPRFSTPHYAVLFTGFLTMLAPLLGREALIAFVDAGSFCIVIAFLGVALSLVKLRRRYPDVERPYRVPGGLVIPYLAVAGSLGILAAMIVPGSPAALVWPREVMILGVVIGLGMVFWRSGEKMRRGVSEEERSYLILEEFVSSTAR